MLLPHHFKAVFNTKIDDTVTRVFFYTIILNWEVNFVKLQMG